MGERLDQLQAAQEDEYSFPYHHVAQSRGGFVQFFNDAWGINYLSTVEYLIERLRGETFSSIVDIGCGDGRMTKELGLAFPNAHAVGVDFSARAIALAKAMVPEGDFRCADITIPGAIPETFDAGILMEVYEHIPPDVAPQFVDAVAGLLRSGAVLYVTVPHVNKPVEYKHFRHFTAKTLMADFERRFELLEIVPFEKRSVRKRIIDRILTNQLFLLFNRRIGGWIYRYYRRHLFLAGTERRCGRLLLRMRKR